MELEWKKPIKIPDGMHSGEITKIGYRNDPYEYTDIMVKPDNIDVEMKLGCPSNLSENSKLGKVLIAFGATAEEGAKIDPEKVLVGQKVTFMTLTKKGKDNKEYSEIVEGSLKPKPPVPA